MVAVQKDPKFPYASFKCTMCDCYFNDEYAKKAHVKGRRHRLNFKVFRGGGGGGGGKGEVPSS